MSIDVNCFVGGPELLASVSAAALPAQPLAVDELRAGEIDAHARAGEAFDRFAIVGFGSFAGR